MKLQTTPFNLLESTIRTHLTGKQADDEIATMLAIRVPLAQLLGPDLTRTLIQHPQRHDIYLRVRLELLGNKVAGPPKEGRV